jgi:hypothetical protein
MVRRVIIICFVVAGMRSRVTVKMSNLFYVKIAGCEPDVNATKYYLH